ncbi:MAG: NAD-dependent epimerase/dehydratase family protein [Deltaproteobacteria bacterium]|nr:NAD-dependent epimerase/dehydratase family protein [Deltaproteobacteria bacterium]
MKVVVTGASGHLGGNLVRLLLEKKRDVKVVIRDDTRAIEGLDVDPVRADVLDEDSLVKAFSGAGVVYHLAAVITIAAWDGEKVEAVNVAGVRNVVSACLKTGVKKLVHFSSIHAHHQFPRDQPLDEKREYADVNPRALPYDQTKARGEREVLAGVQKGLDAVIVNPTGVLGPHDFKPSRMGEALLGLYRRRLPALVEGAFDWVDARDVCMGAIEAETRGRPGEKYLLSGAYLPFRELAKLVEDVTGVRAPRFTTPQWLARVGAPFVSGWSRVVGKRPLYTSDSLEILRTCNPRISHAKASNELGYDPRPLRQTIEDTFRWFEWAGLLKK